MLVKIAFYSLLAYIFALGWMEPYLTFAGQKIQISDLFFLTLASLFCVAVLLRRIKLHWHNSFGVLLFFLFTQFLSAFFSVDQQTSFIKFLGKVYLIAVPVIIFHLIDSVENFKMLLKTWLISAGVCALIGVLSVFLFYTERENPLLNYTLFHSGTLPSGNYPRLSSTFLNANLLCNYLSVGICLLLIANRQNWINAYFFWPILSIFLTCVFFTFSPGLGGVGLIFGIWGWLLFRSQRPFFSRTVLIGGILTAVFFLATASFSLKPQPNPLFRITVPVAGIQLEPSARMLTWISSFETFIENPIFGKGVGVPVCQVHYVDFAARQQFLNDAHNSFLNIAAESGVLGLSAFVLLCFYFIKSSAKNFEYSVKSGLFCAFLSAFLYQGLSGSFEDARHLWVLIGLIAVIEKFDLSFLKMDGLKT